MTGKEVLAARFEANRNHLRSVAYRILGSKAQADDAVQETYLRLMRADQAGVDNFAGWLTTVVARICLDMLRERKQRHEVPVDGEAETLPAADTPENEMLIADSIGIAMLVVLETLTPTERVAFVLHDIFDVSFDEIAPIIGRSSMAARQLASRGRRRIQGVPTAPQADRARQREVVGAFLAASRGGDLSSLVKVLAPDVVMRADAAAVKASAARAGQNVPLLSAEISGHESVADLFRNRLKAAQLALVDGDQGLVIAPQGQPRLVIDFVLEDGRIVEISLIGDPERIAALDLEL